LFVSLLQIKTRLNSLSNTGPDGHLYSQVCLPGTGAFSLLKSKQKRKDAKKGINNSIKPHNNRSLSPFHSKHPFSDETPQEKRQNFDSSMDAIIAGDYRDMDEAFSSPSHSVSPSVSPRGSNARRKDNLNSKRRREVGALIEKRNKDIMDRLDAEGNNGSPSPDGYNSSLSPRSRANRYDEVLSSPDTRRDGRREKRGGYPEVFYDDLERMDDPGFSLEGSLNESSREANYRGRGRNARRDKKKKCESKYW